MDNAKSPGTVDQDLQDDIEKNDCMDGFEKEQEDMTLYNILSSYLGKVTGGKKNGIFWDTASPCYSVSCVLWELY